MNNPAAKVIEIIVSPAGESTVRTEGFLGPACRDASRFVERALGEKTSETLTAEFHQSEPARQQVRQD
jgi:hypothetical protein